MIAQLTSMTTMYHSQLVEHLTPFSDSMHMPDAASLMHGGASALASLDLLVTQQAAMLAYSNDFLLMMFVSLCAFPLLALIRKPRIIPKPDPAHAVMD